MYSYTIDPHQARSIFMITLSLIVLATITALLAATYPSYYGTMGAFSAAFSVGSGIMFSFLVIYMGSITRRIKFILPSLLLVTIVSFVILDLPSSQYSVGGTYHSNLVGQIATIPFVVSLVSFILTVTYVIKRRKVVFSIKGVYSRL